VAHLLQLDASDGSPTHPLRRPHPRQHLTTHRYTEKRAGSDLVDSELRRFARHDERCQALQAIYGIGPILACHLLAEIGEACRFQRAEQITRLAGLDPVVAESGETGRRGKLAKAGSPHLRWALVEAAVHAHGTTAPDLALYRSTRARRDTTVARLTVARKIGKRAFHALRELELTAT
jgi:transposase